MASKFREEGDDEYNKRYTHYTLRRDKLGGPDDESFAASTGDLGLPSRY